MKVIHLSAEKTWRGGEQQIAYLHQELQALNVQQLVVCRENSAFEAYCIKHGIAYKSIPFKNQFDLYSSLKLKRISQEFAADIIHIHSSHAHAIAVWAYFLGNKTNLVLSRKVDFPISKNILSKIKYNCLGIKKIICVSDAIKIIMQESIKQPNKCVTIYDGIDLSKFSKGSDKLRSEYKIDTNTKIIASTAAIADHKDYPTFVKAVKLCHQKINAKFFIIGEGPLTSEIKQLVKEEGLSDNILFTGFRTDVNELLPNIDVFVLSSKTEGLGSSILDAYACKVPVVCTNAGGIKEIAENEITALVSNVGDATALANNMIRICTDEILKEKLRSAAFEKVQNFDKKIMAEKTLALYNSIFSFKAR